MIWKSFSIARFLARIIRLGISTLAEVFSVTPLRTLTATSIRLPHWRLSGRKRFTGKQQSRQAGTRSNFHLLNVPGFSGILIHPGTTANDTEGCVLVGRNLVKGKILQSRDTFSRLYSMFSETERQGEDIYITITHENPFTQ